MAPFPIKAKDAEEALKTEFIRLVPGSKDIEGRQVILTTPAKMNKKLDRKQRVLAVWYVLLAAVQDVETQKRGFCCLVNGKAVKISQLDPKFDKMALESLQGALPLRIGSINMCYPPTFMRVVFAIIHPFMHKRVKQRMRLFPGTDAQRAVRLHSATIPGALSDYFLRQSSSSQGTPSIKERALLDESGRPCEHFTMTREPIDRLVSAFFYCPTDHDKQRRPPEESLDAYVAVGIMGYMDLSMELFNSRVRSPVQDWTSDRRIHNSGQASSTRHEVLEWARAKNPEIHRLLEGDLAMYDYAMQFFKRQTTEALGVSWVNLRS
eukprot:g8078.t1